MTDTKKYELTFLLPADSTEADLAKLTQGVEDLLKKSKGKVVEKEEWGKKTLAYKIKHNGKSYKEAVYFHWVVEVDPIKAPKFETDLLLQEKTIRHLFVVASDEPSALASKKETSKETPVAQK